MVRVARDTVSAKPWRFVGLTFVLSLPFWAIGVLAPDAAERLPVNLPVSALMFVVPLIAALVLAYRDERIGGVRRLLGRAFDHGGITPVWYLPILLLMPGVSLAAYAVVRAMGLPVPEPQVPLLALPIVAAVFVVTAACEELGWMGYAADPLLARWSALATGLALGAVWAVWHAIPYAQAGNGPSWIIWQSLGTVAFRVIIVWLYTNTRRVFAATLFHMTTNVTWVLFPEVGTTTRAVTALLAGAVAVAVTLLWGPRTLARYRFA